LAATTGGNPKQIKNDVDCRAARPKFDNGAWRPAITELEDQQSRKSADLAP
jgi:hypothetical protein